MRVSFFTAMSWFRSWASYFSGYNAAQPEHIGCDESKDAGENGCKDTGRTIVQYSPEGLYWMKITWHIWKCVDANGKEFERLGTVTERENTLIQVTSDPPVKAADSLRAYAKKLRCFADREKLNWHLVTSIVRVRT